MKTKRIRALRRPKDMVGIVALAARIERLRKTDPARHARIMRKLALLERARATL